MHTQSLREATAASCPTTADDLLDLRAACALIGGSRPIHSASLYRNIRKGIYPAPIKIGPGSSRWLRSEIEAVLRKMVEARR